VQQLSAGGSTFVTPLMTRWASEYEKAKGVKIQYQSVGSGEGIRQMIARSVDFGCSDAPMDEQDVLNARKVGGEVVHIPLIMGAVVPAYKLPDVEHPVRFTGPLLADIFLGKITKWNDPQLLAIQEKAVQLPDLDIKLAHRADGSGTTSIFTEYLSKTSPEWRDKIGTNTAVKFPTGVARQGNEGVTEYIQQTSGALGYIELAYVFKTGIQFGAVKNKAGKFIQGGLFTITEAVENALSTIPDDLRYSIVDAAGEQSYPISGTTWALVYVKPPAKGKAIVDFLRWATHEGQKFADELDYAPLPPALVDRVDKKLKTIQGQ